MNTTHENAESWEPCEAGLLIDCSKRAKSARSRKSAARLGGGVLALLVVVGVVAWSANQWHGPHENHFGGLACHEVKRHMPALLAGTLSEDLTQRMHSHLDQCSYCRQIMENIEQQQASQEHVNPLPASRGRSEIAVTDTDTKTDSSAMVTLATSSP